MQKLIIFIFLVFNSSIHAIVGGERVDDDSIIVASTVSLVSNSKSFCTGTLITPIHVVTAAHCFLSNKSFRVGFGINLNSVQFRLVESVTVHQDFNRIQFVNDPFLPPHDIALIKLKTRAPLGFTPVKIASDFVKSGDSIFLAGFGQTSFFNGTAGDLKVVTTVVNEKLDESLEFLFGPTPGRSACRGDSGGPAYKLGEDGGLFLIGVTSRGVSGKVDGLGRSIGCSGEGFYTDVLEHLDWITSNL